MAFYLSPLVKVREVDLSNTVASVATAIACTVLRNTYKGPERKQYYVTNESTLISTFGYPTNVASCYRDMFTALGYYEYGSELYCTRVMPDDATFAGKVAVSGSQATSELGGVTDWISFGVSGSTPSAYTLDDLTSWDPVYFQEDINWSDYTGDNYPLVFIADSRGAWGNNIRLAILDYYTANLLSASGGTILSSWETSAAFNDLDSPVPDNKSFVVIVECKGQGSSEWTKVETWNVSTDPNSYDDMGISRFVEGVINTNSNYIKVALNSLYSNSAVALSTSSWMQFGSGSDGTLSETLESQCISGYALYADPDAIDINIFIDSDKSVTVKDYIVSVCEDRMDAMAILDVPYANVVNARGNIEENLRVWVRNTLNLNTSYACIYGNWLEVYDKYNGKYRWVPSSGHAAGIFANTDSINDPWFAPAGLNRAKLTNVRRLAYNPNQAQRDLLYKNRINPIVGFAGQGQVVWGQKTLLDKESAFNRINVRRLFMVLEKSIATAAKYYLFEPNDATTRMLLVNMIDPFLRDVKARRGIYSFLIVCDETNNTPERIDRNELYCDIYLKPVKTAEFIVLSFIATKTGVSFNEIVSTATTI